MNEDFPLRSFVVCSCCRQPYTASWSKGRNRRFAYYRCKTKGCSERNKSVKKEVLESEFELILKKIKPSQGTLNLTKAILADIWMKKESEIIQRRKNIEAEVKSIGEEIEKLTQLILRAKDESVISMYEEKISSLSKKKLVLKSSAMSFDKHKPNIETALDIVFDFLKDPLKQWQKGNIHTKKLVLKLVFEQNLAYNRKSGFETAVLSLPLRVFTLPLAQKSSLVLSAGIEPAS